MRLFTALDVPEAILHDLERLLDHLRPTAKISWSNVSNLHITTKFIGEWPEERLGELTTALTTIKQSGTIPVHVHKLGFFPNPHSPRPRYAGPTNCPKKRHVLRKP